MILSDYWIRDEVYRGNLLLDPMPPDSAFQPSSLELRLGEDVVLGAPGSVDLWDHQLSHTLETVTIPSHLVAKVEGKSSWGRMFLQVHSTAGHIDPGFSGQVVLELKNLGPYDLKIDAGTPICQLVFHEVRLPVLRPYGHPGLGSHYQGQRGTRKSYMEES